MNPPPRDNPAPAAQLADHVAAGARRSSMRCPDPERCSVQITRYDERSVSHARWMQHRTPNSRGTSTDVGRPDKAWRIRC